MSTATRRRPPTDEQRARAQERRERMRELADTIAAMPEEKRAELAAQSGVITIEGHPLSPTNTCMVALQLPTATVVGGFQQWRRAGRHVRKGEHALSIWIPLGPRTAAESPEVGELDKPRPRFILGSVFDVSQTDPNDDGPAPADGPVIVRTPPAPKCCPQCSAQVTRTDGGAACVLCGWVSDPASL